VEKPLSTPEMSAREAEEMANAMLQNSPLPEAGKSDGRLPESGGSDNLPEEGVTRSCLKKPLQVNS